MRSCIYASATDDYTVIVEQTAYADRLRGSDRGDEEMS